MKKDPESYRHGNLAQALVEDAVQMLRTIPPEDLSLRELAQRAGVSPRAPYVHFPSKSDLLREVALHGFRDLSTQSLNAGHDLMALGRVYLNFAAENPNLYRLMFYTTISMGSCEEPERSYHHLLETMRQMRPTMSEDQITHAGLALWSLVHGYADLRSTGLVEPDCNLELMLSGLTALLSP